MKENELEAAEFTDCSIITPNNQTEVKSNNRPKREYLKKELFIHESSYLQSVPSNQAKFSCISLSPFQSIIL